MKKIFYGSDGWIVGLQDLEPFKLDQNDDVEYVSISSECFDFLVSHLPLFTWWRIIDGKLSLCITDEEKLKLHDSLYEHICELCKQYTSELYFLNLFNI